MLPEDNRRQKKLLSGLNYDRQQILSQRGYTSRIHEKLTSNEQWIRKIQRSRNLRLVYIPQTGAGVRSSQTSIMMEWKDIFITNGYVKDVTDIDFRDYICE